MNASYEAIEKVAKKLGYPDHWSDDVYCWDRQFIEKNNPSSFAWVIRRYGSHIMGIGPELEDPIMIEYAEALTTTFEEGDKHYYVWHGAEYNDPHLTHCSDARTWLEMIRKAERTRAHPTMRRKYAKAQS